MWVTQESPYNSFLVYITRVSLMRLLCRRKNLQVRNTKDDKSACDKKMNACLRHQAIHAADTIHALYSSPRQLKQSRWLNRRQSGLASSS